MDLNQVTLEASNFEQSLAFYKMLGLRLIVLSEGRYARFELPSGSSTLSLHQADQPSVSNLMLYFEVDDVDARYTKLLEAGIKFDSPPSDKSWRWREARFSDPAGNKLCLYHGGLDRRFPPWRVEAADA